MMKNRGIPKSKSYRKKGLTPRLKQKKKFKKAIHKMVSKGY